MKKYILGLVAVLVFVSSYSYVNAVEDIDPNPNTNECISLVNNLRYRDRDANKSGEVSTLQDFLQAKGYLDSEPTGYFGILTLRAVKDFQKANNINPTGYVGSVTRAKIKNLTCGDIVPPIITCPSITTPASNFCPNGKIEPVKNENNCVISYRCVDLNTPAIANLPNTTSSVPAPSIIVIPRNPGGVISYNSSDWINWMSYNSTSCTLSADNQIITTTSFSSVNPTITYGNTSGSKEVGPLTKSTIYTIKCIGPGGVTTKQEIIEVKPDPTFCVNGKIESVKNSEGKILSYNCINQNIPSWYGFSNASYFDMGVTHSIGMTFQDYMLLEGDDVAVGETIYLLAYNQNDRNVKIYTESSSLPIKEIVLDYYKDGKYIVAYQIPEKVGEKIYFTSNNKKSTVLNVISKVLETDLVRLGLLWRTKEGSVVETIKKSSGGIYLSSRAPYSGTWRVYKKDTNELVKEFLNSEIISGGPSHNRSHPYTTFEYISRVLFNPPSSGEYYFTIETGIKGVTTTYNVYRSSNLIVTAD